MRKKTTEEHGGVFRFYDVISILCILYTINTIYKELGTMPLKLCIKNNTPKILDKNNSKLYNR